MTSLLSSDLNRKNFKFKVKKFFFVNKDYFDYTKYKIKISGNSAKEIIVSFIQDCLRTEGRSVLQPIDLQIYLFDNKNEVNWCI